MTKTIQDREWYESKGWTDGRLGQAFDLIDAVLEDAPEDGEAFRLIRRAAESCESADTALEGDRA